MKYGKIFKIVLLNLIIIFFVLQVKSLNINEYNKPQTNESKLSKIVVLQIRKLNMILSTIDSIVIKEETGYVFIGQSFYVKNDSSLVNKKFTFSIKNKSTNEIHIKFLFVISDDCSFWIPYNNEIAIQNTMIRTFDTSNCKGKICYFGEFKIASQYYTSKHDLYNSVCYSNAGTPKNLIVQNKYGLDVNFAGTERINTGDNTIKTDNQYNSPSYQNYYSENKDYTGIIADASFQNIQEDEFTNSNYLITNEAKILNNQNNYKQSTFNDSRDKEYKNVFADPNFSSITSGDEFQVSNVKSKSYYNKPESAYEAADSRFGKVVEINNSIHYVDFSGAVADSQFIDNFDR